MKIRITDKENPKDEMIVDLSKLSAVRVTQEKELALYSNISAPANLFPNDDYKFEIVEASADLRKVYYVEKTLDWILRAYSSQK